MHMGTTERARHDAPGWAVHPHAHGDNANGEHCSTRRDGSPPCTWGQHDDWLTVEQPSRFTPMHMGTTTPAAFAWQDNPVHPHAHGDNYRPAGPSAGQFGSPPCTWGQQLKFPAISGVKRFTPMHMGTTRPVSRVTSNLPVHPHAHGDNSSTTKLQASVHGSPPCTWGQRLHEGALRQSCRFTPMHMGTTSRLPASARSRRFTPMHMGTTATLPIRPSRRSVHPHAHGDNSRRVCFDGPPRRFTPMHMGTTTRCEFSRQSPGSPPCTWGQRAGTRHRGRGCRFTPMHMGTTVVAYRPLSRRRRFTPMHMGTT